MISALAAFGTERETITTGRVFAAKPRSASQISPGRGFIQHVQNVLLARPGAQQIERILIRQSDNLGYAFTYLVRCLRVPLMQSGVQRFKQGFHRNHTSKPFYVVPASCDSVTRRASYPQTAFTLPPKTDE